MTSNSNETIKTGKHYSRKIRLTLASILLCLSMLTGATACQHTADLPNDPEITTEAETPDSPDNDKDKPTTKK